jgi:hypothetical protein
MLMALATSSWDWSAVAVIRCLTSLVLRFCNGNVLFDVFPACQSNMLIQEVSSQGKPVQSVIKVWLVEVVTAKVFEGDAGGADAWRHCRAAAAAAAAAKHRGSLGF